ncbi:LysM peptidoglycan-binding domain-containing protein [Myroides guanonis]|uniref:LysM domain-containing protein n=1 Tax=Myroides guanonis TaxID=1150112 RepID=A0A1I3UJ09_9FLAO|nr:LysM peptidoglycan-binding domain-containing protein [Myroides guanonis]SFJ81816.1 LysM domain-containing protein [Myroides guanonis]
MKISKSYLLQSFAILVMATGFFLFFKTYLPKKIFSESTKPTNNVVVDSLMLEALEREDSLRLTNKDLKVDSPSELISDEPEHTFKGLVYLDSFFEILHQIELNHKGKARIAYFGDSMTDGDLIVQDLRKNFQQKYGGSGVGFVGITSESANSRGSITHKYSNNWKTQSYLNVKRPLKPFGVNGQVFFAKDTIQPTWIHLKAGTSQTMNTLPSPVLYYGKSNNQHGTVSWVSGKDTIVRKLNPVENLNAIKVSDGAIRDLKVNFNQADSIPIYGFDFTSRVSGVQVDNFSSRGNSGLPLSLLQPSLMNRFQKELQYNLIVLHYGTNVLNYGSYNYGWYTKQMSKVVEHLRSCFPDAAILVISTADKATKYELHMQTDSAVMPLVKAQRKYAIEKHTGFFNLFESMGGKNAMISWVETEPAKANKDYTHFNHRGAQQVGKMVFDYLEKGFEDYKERKENGEVSKPKPQTKEVVVKTSIANTDAKTGDSVSKTSKKVQATDTSRVKTVVVTETKKKEVVKTTAVQPISSGTGIRYTVVEGDTYTLLSQRYGVSIEEIKKANGLHGDALHKDWKIWIPRAKKVNTPVLEGQAHIVKEGETLHSIARRYNTTAGKLKRHNNLDSREVRVGQRLYIMEIKDTTSNSNDTKSKQEVTRLYEVKEGDTLTSLARKFNTTVQRLKELNNLGEDGIEIEQVILVPNVQKEE